MMVIRKLFVGLMALVLVATAIVNVPVAAQDDDMMIDFSVLLATGMDGLPEDVEEEDWFYGTAAAFMDMGDEGTDTITVIAEDLVAEGLYTVWWVNTDPEMSMGPAAGTEGSFTADEDGFAEFSFEVASDNDYQWIILAFHADGQTHGDSPGEMGVETFSHLIGAFPGPGGNFDAEYYSPLATVDMDGVPDGIDAETWGAAIVEAYAVEGMDGLTTVGVLAEGLVPEGVYTLWWVNDMMDMDSMSMGPAAGPEGVFVADEEGFGYFAFQVESDNDYQTLILAYHADGQTYGDNPGEMGVITFSHAMGGFPGPEGLIDDMMMEEME